MGTDLTNYTTVQLVNELTQGLEDELLKVRALFLFIASIDVGQLQKPADDYEPNGPLEYLLKIKGYTGNHAHMFCALCK